MAKKFRSILSIILTLCIALSLLPTDAVMAVSEPIEYSTYVYADKDVYGYVVGLQETDYKNAIVLLYNTVNSYSAGVGADGAFCFDGIEAGDYYLKIEVEGYRLSYPVKITVEEAKNLRQDLNVVAAEGSDYFYQWKADETYFGFEESAKVPEEKTVVFLDEVIYTSDSGAADKLERKYNIILSNEEVKWSSDYASRMLDLVDGIYGFSSSKPSKWILTADEIDDDVEILYGMKGDTIRICKRAFENAIPRKAEYNGLKGTYFSNRLYHALVRYATKEGTDASMIDALLRHDYGCSIIVEDYADLTKGITNETNAAFEQFKPEELLAILEMFAEMPEGFHRIEHLEYLVRRIDGAKHPIYPDAAAVSWIYAEHGYIEFMDSAFLGSEVEDTFRLLLHEKSHFLWTHVFSDALKAEWAEIGGWYQTDKDSDGWATSKETEFVTAYAHAHNPDEDMAESIAYYILMPNRLESRSPAKYAFIRDYIMNGEIYMAQIREDLTFEVYNLYPDYNYPGRIVGVDVQLDGAPEEDKLLTVTVTIDTHGDISYGAQSAFMRILSDVDQYYDLWLHPINEDHSVLQGTLTISKYSWHGYWHNEQIILTDEVGNQRFSGVDSFGWKLYVNNPLQDTEPPQYVKDSVYVETEEGTVDGRSVTYVYVKFKVTDNIGIDNVYCQMANNTHDSYRLEAYGSYDSETEEGTITFTFTEYMQSGEYSVNYISAKDTGGNYFSGNFYSDGTGLGKPATFVFESENSDYIPPELDVNNIVLSAYPTHPDNPNGETLVTIDYLARDNASGLGLVSFQLLDPLGNTHSEYHYHPNFYTLFFDGDPTAWTRYQINIILPEGSVPGKWGLLEMYLTDKAGNFKHYNFLEIVHFVIDTEAIEPSYTLSIEEESLSVGEEIQIYFEGKARSTEYIWRCENLTGTAQINQDGVLKGITPGDVKVYLYEAGSNGEDTKYGMIDVTIMAMSDTHEHDGVAFKAWSDSTSLPTAAGNYYLTVDVELENTWYASSEVVNLCLNGHKITCSDITAISVKPGCTLNVYDCSEYESGTITGDFDAITNYGMLTVYGGDICGGSFGINNYEILTVYGGDICGASSGIDNNGPLIVFGGTIKGDKNGINNSYDIFSNRGGQLIVVGGIITGTENGISSIGKLTVNGGTISGGKYGLYITEPRFGGGDINYDDLHPVTENLNLAGDAEISGSDADICLMNKCITITSNLNNSKPYTVVNYYDYSSEPRIVEVFTNTKSDNLIYNDPTKFVPATKLAERGYIVIRNDDGQLQLLLDKPQDLSRGDLNGDGRVNINDAIELLKQIAGLPNNVVKDVNCDLDGDTKVNINDAIYLLKMIANLV